MMHVQRSKGELCKPKNTVASFKHDGGSIVFWGCLAASGTSTLHLNGLTKKDDYILVLQIYLKSTFGD